MASSVVFFRSDWDGCGFYRCEQPVGALVRAGVAATVADKVQTRNTGTAITGIRTPGDVLVFQRPLAVGLPEVIAAARREGRRVLVELDDDVWSVAPHNPAASFFTREALGRLGDCLRLADRVIASTAALAARIASVTGQREIAVIPNAVDPALAGPPRESGPDRELVVGWAGGASHRADFRVARDAVLAAQRWSTEVHFYGDDPLAGTPGPRRIHPWTGSVPAHYRNIAAFDVALAPLENSRFNRSKSALKWMEHALHQTPMTLSNVGPYEACVRHGETGLLAGSRHDFERNVMVLVRDRKRASDIGASAYDEVTRCHLIEHRVTLYRQVLGC